MDLALERQETLYAKLARVTRQRDAAVEALRRIASHDPETCDGITPRDCVETMREIARAAIAAVEEKPE